MDYKIMNNTLLLRIDQGEYVIDTIKKVCVNENIKSGTFQGIGDCNHARLATWIEKKVDFIHHDISGMLEMVSLMGNISVDTNDTVCLHSHALFSYLEDEKTCVIAGHLEDARISYTGEIVINIFPSPIKKKFCDEIGIEIWDFDKK